MLCTQDGRHILRLKRKAPDAGQAVEYLCALCGEGGLIAHVLAAASAAVGLPAGLGAPFFEGVEAVMAAQLFSIPAVKGVEFGAGFGAAVLRGSEYNDPYVMSDGRVATARNSAGGLLGGISNGMPIVVRTAFRPTPSISLEQQTVSLSQQTPQALAVRGRHDPCVAVRAVPVVEGAVALALLELWLERRASLPLAAQEGL